LITDIGRQVWDTAYFPITTSALFDRFGQSYDITRVISSDHKLDVEAYQAYSPVYISVTYAMTFTAAFGLTTAAVVHTVLHQGERIYKTLRSRKFEEDDIHLKHMLQYPEVPDWYIRPTTIFCFFSESNSDRFFRWFAVFLVATFIFGIIAVEVGDLS
jgi:hypothetical protein